MKKTFFVEREGYLKEQLKIGEKKGQRYGNIKLALFILGVYVTYLSITKQGESLWGIGTILIYALFISLCIVHHYQHIGVQRLKKLYKINKRYLERIEGAWKHFTDTGEEFVDSKHPYSVDLDIVGKDSLFQLLNTTVTKRGRQKLAMLLLNPDKNKVEVCRRQDAIKELTEQHIWCQELESVGYGEKITHKEEGGLKTFIEDKEQLIKNKGLQLVLAYWPCVMLPIIGVLVGIGSEMAKYVMIGYLAINGIALVGLTLMKTNKLGLVMGYAYEMKQDVALMKVMQQISFKSPLLKEIQTSLGMKEEGALAAFKRLEKCVSHASYRYQPIAYLLLNFICLWDYWCIFEMEAWRELYSTHYERWLDELALVEALVSLSVLGQIEEDMTYPIFEEQGKKVIAQQLGHPMLKSDERVGNEVHMDEHVYMITGSNMCGKTTYLRTIGISLVLAYSGAPVCGKKMVCSFLNICTSMKITDDLNHGISTFYAELIRIRKIIETAKEDSHTLFLIDELFRGTNSKDRLLGAKNVLMNLIALGAIGGLTTHDLELATLHQVRSVKQFHFEEYYKENKIFFDYKIREGVATKTNAIYLMKLVGIDIV